jgi:hypothetical protein
MPNWLFAALMTVRVRFSGVAALEVELSVGVLVSGCNGVSLGDVDAGALGAPALVPASSPQPVMTMTHAANTAMRCIQISSFPEGFDRTAGRGEQPATSSVGKRPVNPSLVGLACRRRASPCDDRHAPERRQPKRN